MTTNNFIKAMQSGGMVEVLRCDADGNQLSVLFRVFNKKNWLKTVEYILARKRGWDAHICQQYFLKGAKLVFGWNFILEAEDELESAMANAASLLSQGQRVAVQLPREHDPDTVPLVGAGAYRTAKQDLDPSTGLPRKGGAGVTRA
jgi:hypothetical protein